MERDQIEQGKPALDLLAISKENAHISFIHWEVCVMFGPRQEGEYPGRNLDCQEAVSQGIADLIAQATLSGGSEAEAASALSRTDIPGIRDLINDAVEAGWSVDEAARAVAEVAKGMQVGYAGIDPNE